MRLRVLAAALVVVTGAGGCASSDGGGSGGGDHANHQNHQNQQPSASSDPEAPALVIDIAISGGNVTPTNAQFQANVGKPIELRVNSDATDELHVHSNPEHSFPVEPKQGQSFTFTAEVPGTVDVELHELNRTVATIQVRQ